ncbi:hypothetical protein A3B51_00205 [Candidatus Curtissbacteria bacterium RIFCSPLOWO2_01_FULL_41_18]|uniref:Uncharacterized protein n=2 Tax=Candidatus Curtissiibacteriota TaxID=1752717 RepID=A0A1F5HKP5_9BACT|nr:MAG: hypothetical protein A3B51_00205 [Candidatus Curtissbacteria bacterium RIFCSPLOWO2_01_FULL_41_18]
MTEHKGIRTSKEYGITEYKIGLQDSDAMITIRLSRKGDSYVVTWLNPDISTNDFFSKAQTLVNSIKEAGNNFPLKRKMFSGLDYSLDADGKDLHEIDIEVFEPIEELGDASFARFNTPYGDFTWENWPGNKVLGVITHVNSPDELFQFIMDNSHPSAKDGLREILEDVGQKASQKMAESEKSGQKAS